MSVHYEIYRRMGKSGWSLVEAMNDRQPAIDKAKEVLESGAMAAKVVKETLQSDGEFLGLTIFEESKESKSDKKKRKPDQRVETPLPCFKPDDLYSYHARMTI